MSSLTHPLQIPSSFIDRSMRRSPEGLGWCSFGIKRPIQACISRSPRRCSRRVVATSRPALINDQVTIAKVLAADGAHLGQGDGSLLDARQSLGPHAVLGRTCHGSQEFMEQAVADGASYCAFGRLFDSDTKPHASGLSLHQLKDLVSQCAIPTVAIGGITLDNGRQILDTGVAMLAVSGAVFRAKEIGEAARRLSELF